MSRRNVDAHSRENTNNTNAASHARGDLGDVGRLRGTSSDFVPPNMDLNEEEVKSLFETFIRTHREPDTVGNDWDESLFDVPAPRTPYYVHQLRLLLENSQITDSPMCNFPIDLSHIMAASSKLMKATIMWPADVIVYFDEVLADMVKREYESYGISDNEILQQGLALKVSFFNHPRIRCMRDLDPKDVESLIAIRGIIIRCSSVIPDMRVAVFRCTNKSPGQQASELLCSHEVSVYVANGEVQEPVQCIKCNGKYSFELFHSRCTFGNKQLIKLQETPESIPEGETPQTVLAYIYDELVDKCKPGDFVELTGIFRASGIRVLPRTRTLKATYRTYIDVNNIYKDRLNRYLVAEADLEGPAADAELVSDSVHLSHNRTQSLSPELVAEIKTMGKDPDIYKKLVQSMAPNIFEADDVKKGLLCQLFGGTTKVISGRASRSDTHVLLCGDPSTAKSQLLRYVHGIAPRGIYTCGRGSSAVGLTASVTRDAESKEFVLESGAIILSDRGVCCIDEFDKMDETARLILHEVMEQQTVSIAKAGIVCSLNARTAILASANPIGSRYNTRRSVVENINLPASLMSRFDLIYLMVDWANEKIDKALAAHICSLYSKEKNTEKVQCPFTRKSLAQYISYAREFCKPRAHGLAKKMLVDAYLDLRRQGGDGAQRSLTATPRQLESLIRLSESLAKMELKDEVEPKHVEEAVRLMQVATYSALIDPSSGTLDFDQLNVGIGGGPRARRELLEALLLTCLGTSSGGQDKALLTEKVNDKLKEINEFPLEASGREFNFLLKELEECGKIGRVHGGKIVSQTSN